MMGGKLPFVGRIFWKILPAVFILAFVVFFVAIKFFDYELTNADIGGSIISGILASYLLHLWTLPAEYFPVYDDEDYEDEDDPDADSDEPASPVESSSESS